MVEYIFSKKIYNKIIHMVNRVENIVEERFDLVAADNFIQCSSLNLSKGKTFRPHQHIWKPGPKTCIAQESWVVISGSVQCDFYDIDGLFLESKILKPGDASFTLQGGHNYLALEDNTLVYEYKTGPYEGQNLDKKFI